MSEDARTTGLSHAQHPVAESQELWSDTAQMLVSSVDLVAACSACKVMAGLSEIVVHMIKQPSVDAPTKIAMRGLLTRMLTALASAAKTLQSQVG